MHGIRKLQNGEMKYYTIKNHIKKSAYQKVIRNIEKEEEVRTDKGSLFDSSVK